MPLGRPYRFHPEASRELEATDDWYFARSFDASIDFLFEVDAAIVSITDVPHRWAKYLYGTRRLVMQRFPFSIVYLNDPDLITIIAIAHAKRKPGYWKGRV
jgi:toxin ParE1/3/4